MLTPKRFWGHPEDWSIEAWEEYLKITSKHTYWDVFVCWMRGWR